MSDSIVWVKWNGNNSKRHDRKINGMPRESLANPYASTEVGDSVDVWWGSGKSRRIGHGTVVLDPEGRVQK